MLGLVVNHDKIINESAMPSGLDIHLVLQVLENRRGVEQLYGLLDHVQLVLDLALQFFVRLLAQ